jgi:hypothetical protein
MTAILDSFNSFSYDYFFKYIPCVTPALKEEGFEVDRELLQNRVSLLAVVALATFATALLTAQPALIVFTATVLTALACTLLALMDFGWAELMAEQNAIDNFINTAEPSLKAIQMFQNDPDAAATLMKASKDPEKKVDLTKTAANGSKLLLSISGPEGQEVVNIPCLESFKVLVKEGVSLKIEGNLITLLSYPPSKSEDYYEYVKKEKLVDASDFTEEERERILEYIQPYDTTDLRFWFLHDLNFKVPIPEEESEEE